MCGTDTGWGDERGGASWTCHVSLGVSGWGPSGRGGELMVLCVNKGSSPGVRAPIGTQSGDIWFYFNFAESCAGHLTTASTLCVSNRPIFVTIKYS